MVNNTAASPARRSLLIKVWKILGLAVVLQLLAGAAFFLATGRRRTGAAVEELVNLGPVADFLAGSVTLSARGNFYLCHLDEGGFLAISRKCTHLGCAVPWVAERSRFECPCHASVFDRTGNVLKSPAPRALDLYPVSFEHGSVVVNTAVTVRRAAFSKDQLSYPPEQG